MKIAYKIFEAFMGLMIIWTIISIVAAFVKTVIEIPNFYIKLFLLPLYAFTIPVVISGVAFSNKIKSFTDFKDSGILFPSLFCVIVVTIALVIDVVLDPLNNLELTEKALYLVFIVGVIYIPITRDNLKYFVENHTIKKKPKFFRDFRR